MDTSLVGDNPSERGVAPSASGPSILPSPLSNASDHDIDEDDGPDVDDDDDRMSQISLYEQILNNETPTPFDEEPGPDACTAEESQQFRRRLRQVGIPQFVTETLGTGQVTARKLLKAFRVVIPAFFDDASDENLYELLGMALLREAHRRDRLPQYRTIDDAVHLLQTRNNIMVITGAGISTSLGIPDFRSKNTGFYSKLQDMGYEEPEEVFDLQNFDEDASTFYKLAGDILPTEKRWTPTHHFIRMLQDKSKLLRNYTQNIDNVEEYAGIDKAKLIQCHGSWATATCRKCGYTQKGSALFDSIRQKEIAYCEVCKLRIANEATAQNGLKRKRSNGNWKPRKGRDSDDSSDVDDDIPMPGIMKPDITFFGEKLPDKFFNTLQNVDRGPVDLIIVIGTSMKVAPVSEIPQYVDSIVPQIYISRDPINHINFDINLLGDCDVVVTELCRRAGWDLVHEMVDPNSKIYVEQSADEHTHAVSAGTKPPTAPLGSGVVAPLAAPEQVVASEVPVVSSTVPPTNLQPALSPGGSSVASNHQPSQVRPIVPSATAIPAAEPHAQLASSSWT